MDEYQLIIQEQHTLVTDGKMVGLSGLEIREEGLFHNDLPLSQASGMRQLLLSTRIAMAANPKLKVICIDEGDRLDQEAVEKLESLARAAGYQVWMTGVYVEPENAEVVEMRDGKATSPSTT